MFLNKLLKETLGGKQDLFSHSHLWGKEKGMRTPRTATQKFLFQGEVKGKMKD